MKILYGLKINSFISNFTNIKQSKRKVYYIFREKFTPIQIVDVQFIHVVVHFLIDDKGINLRNMVSVWSGFRIVSQKGMCA